jgi:4'-phosphopantetheinyl transferase EntD
MNLIAVPPSWQQEALIASFEPASEVDSLLDAFAPAEMAVAGTLVSTRRRFEWIACRWAAKQLALRRGDCARPADAVVPSQSERPVLVLAGGAPVFVSLSHSGRYAAAALGRRPVGIDVQVVREINPRAAHLFLSEDETESLKRCSIENALLHYWCAKEATWKRRSESHATLRQTPLLLERAEPGGLLFRTSDGAAAETRRLSADLIAALAR